MKEFLQYIQINIGMLHFSGIAVNQFHQFLVIVFLILVIAYGAIGERGMYAVRETMPYVIQQGAPRSPAVPIPDGSGSQDAAIAPVPVNDLEKYINTKMKG